MATYFENLTIGLHILSILNTNVKFYINQILFTIRFLNLFFIHNFIVKKKKSLKFKHFIDDIAINFLFF